MTGTPRHLWIEAAGAWVRAGLALAWVVGVALQLQQAALCAEAVYPLALAGGLAGLLLARRLQGRWPVLALSAAALAIAAAGFGFAGWRAAARLADALAPAWEGRDLELVGEIQSLPEIAEDGEHAVFAIESARALTVTAFQERRLAGFAAVDGRPPPIAAEPPPGAVPCVPSTVWLGWPRAQRDDRAIAAPPAPLRAGQRWRLVARLRLPHGAMNPDGFDSELWLFDQGLRATGSVASVGELLGEGWAPIEQLRQWVRDRLLLRGGEPGFGPQAAGALAALAVGDQSAVDAAGWEIFRDTGVAHLMSISGLHITMLGWLGARATGALWRRSERLALHVPTPLAARWGGVAVAGLYALVAGWGVPAQRTVLMLAATALLRSLGLDWPAPLLTLVAMVPVTLLDPWALLQPGFWLSFAAVGLLMVSEPVRGAPGPPESADERTQASPGAPGLADARAHAPPRGGLRRFGCAVRAVGRALVATLREGARAQVVASLGLAPLTLVVFRQLSLVGLAANLVAEPWVTLVVTPLALLGTVLPPSWTLAALALHPLLAWLALLAHWPLASVHVAVPPAWGLVAGLLGGVLLVLPLPRLARVAGLPLLLPLLAPFVARPPPGRFELVAADVGQGSAILVRTHAHLLLFDTGPRFGAGSDAGRRMLLPLLQARGEARLDTLVLSHADADHVGGAQALLDRFPVALLRSSLAPGNPLRANALPHIACVAGQRWSWDGVEFRILHPFAPGGGGAAATNATSCVLRVADAAGHSALLPGDIEAPQEAALVAREAGALASEVLLVPHHGSHSSSTPAFLAAVHPATAVIQVGYRSRYGHPSPEVVARYAAAGIAVVRTDQCGAWSWSGGAGVCTRAVRRRYWHSTAPGPLPSGAPAPSLPGPGHAGSDVAIEAVGTPRGAAPTPIAGGSPSSP